MCIVNANDLDLLDARTRGSLVGRIKKDGESTVKETYRLPPELNYLPGRLVSFRVRDTAYDG